MGSSRPENRPVVGYEGLYSVSEDGQVMSLPRDCGHYRTKGKVLQQETTKHGYKRVILSYAGVAVKYAVHRLVATAFIPNPGNKPQINHKDGDKTNNRVSNLEWVTAAENSRHAHDTGLVGESSLKIPVDVRKAVVAYYVRGSSTHGCEGTAAKFGIGKQTVLNIVKDHHTGERV